MHSDIERHHPCTKGHWQFVTLYTLAILAQPATPYILLLYMLIASIRIILKSIRIILLFAFISLLSLAFPILILLEIGLALYFLIIRFNFFKENIRAVILGMALYITPFILPFLAFILSDLFIKLSGISDDKLYTIVIFTYFFVVFLLSLTAHLGLKSLYARGYSFRNASEIMAISPLLVISFILPLLKLDIMLEGMAEPFEVAEPHSTTHSVNPNTHEVSGYMRTYPDGSTHEVSGYIRTNPDGIVGNNLSHHENIPHATSPSTHGGWRIHPISEVVAATSTIVEGYEPKKNQEETVNVEPIILTPAQQKKQNLQTALRQLPTSERNLLVMIYVQRRSLQSVAHAEGYSLDELNIRLEQARKQLHCQMILAQQS